MGGGGGGGGHCFRPLVYCFVSQVVWTAKGRPNNNINNNKLSSRSDAFLKVK